MHYKLQSGLIEQWCRATVNDAVKLFHRARLHPDNETVPLEEIAVRCARSALDSVSETMIGGRDATTKRYLKLCYSRFQREIANVVTAPTRTETIH
jgi:transposase